MVDPVTGAHQKGEAAEREQRHPQPAAGDDGSGEPQPEDGEVGIALDQTERTGREAAHMLGEIGAEKQRGARRRDEQRDRAAADPPLHRRSQGASPPPPAAAEGTWCWSWS